MGQGDLATLARQIIAQGPKVVFITEGAKGARAVTATQDRFVAAQKITVADTVGAGDTFNAGRSGRPARRRRPDQGAACHPDRRRTGRRPVAGHPRRRHHLLAPRRQPALGA